MSTTVLDLIHLNPVLRKFPFGPLAQHVSKPSP